MHAFHSSRYLQSKWMIDFIHASKVKIPTNPNGATLYTKYHKRSKMIESSKGSKIRSQYNQVPHPTQDTNGKVTNSQYDTTNESQEVSPFPAGDHKAHINRRAQRHSKHKTEQKHKRSTKEVPPWNGHFHRLYSIMTGSKVISGSPSKEVHIIVQLLSVFYCQFVVILAWVCHIKILSHYKLAMVG